MAADTEFLSFKFAPHILEDLGVNLYTSVAKALVEFIANAHDADSSFVNITFDEHGISHARGILKENFKLEKAKADPSSLASLQPLAERTLPEDIEIIIEDDGVGMSRSDLENKFLVIGRRRRKGKEKTARTAMNRIIMGRKGLGKLAGFGIAHLIEVTSKVESEAHATQVILDLDALLSEGAETHEKKKAEPHDPSEEPSLQHTVKIPVITIADGAGLEKGTRIVLKRLVFDAVRKDLDQTLDASFAENFYGIAPADFAIKINSKTVNTAAADFAYAYPDNDTVEKDKLVSAEIPVDEDGSTTIKIDYRVRFRPSKKQLAAKARGMRVYAHQRLASVPDLLDVKSSAHGFQYTSYLDGIVVADFIDEQPTDYISTDRQSLRWDTPTLGYVKDFLTKEMTRALYEYAETVSAKLENTIKDDIFTKDVIHAARLPEHRQRNAWQIAKLLAGKDSGDLESDFYRSTMKSVVTGIGHGQILETIQKLSEQDAPELRDVINEITKLTRHEYDEFVTIVDARIKVIDSLAKLVHDVDFKAANNEKELHVLFEKSPWLIDPTYFEFLTSDQSVNTLSQRLAKHLEIGEYAPKGYNPKDPKEADSIEDNDDALNRRPDLTFTLSNQSLHRLVIVELKAPNTPLQIAHLNQLRLYMTKAREFLEKTGGSANTKVEGMLIGSRALGSKAEGIVTLDGVIKDEMNQNANWRVFDIAEVLERTKGAHREILDVYGKASLTPVAELKKISASEKN